MSANGPRKNGSPDPMPPAKPAAGATAAAPPQLVRVSFWLWIAMSALLLLSALLVFTTDRSAVAASLRAGGPDLTQQQIDAGVTMFYVLNTVVAALFIAITLTGAFQMRKGKNWARITLTVFGAIMLLLTLSGAAAANLILSFLLALMLGTAIVLMYVADSGAFFRGGRKLPY